MRDRWLEEHVGSEAAVRPEFEAQLGQTLQSAWQQPARSVGPRRPSGPSRRAQVFIWSTAAAVLLIGGAVGFSQRENSSVTPTTDDVTVSTTAAPVSTSGVETTLRPDTTAAASTSLPTTTAGPVVVATSDEERTVLNYLTALAEERYDDAARVLGDGGLSWGDRSDLRPLLNGDGQLPDLAESLKSWCQSPALCQLPTTLINLGSRVAANFTVDGVTRTTMFVAATFEGSPLVYGLPPQLPEGASLADVVQCPTQPVDDSIYADLEGDGWYETVTLSEGLSGDYKLVTACGSSLSVPTFAVPVLPGAVPTGLFSIDVDDDSADELLVATFDPDGFTATGLTLDGETLIATGLTVSLSALRGESFGCVDLDGDGVRDLVNYAYSFIGGTDISNSTELEYEATGTVDASSGAQLALPDQAEEAFRLISGFCGNFPTQTG